jgi:hypothetical protein
MTILVVFFFALMIYVIVVNTQNKYNWFFLAVILAAAGYYVYIGRLRGTKANADMMAYIDQLEKRSAERHIMVSPLYYNYKSPRKFRYLRNFPDMLQWLYDMRYFDTYDKQATLILASLFERFFMVHYKIVMKQYDADSYMANLVDIRDDVVNYMYAMIHEFPSHSTIVDVNMDEYHYHMLLRVQVQLCNRPQCLSRLVEGKL